MIMKETLENISLIAIIVVFITLIFGVFIMYNQWAYNDWTCFVKNCTQTSQSSKWVK